MSKRVLIIDDESGFCEVVKDVLDEVGYEVDTPPCLCGGTGTLGPSRPHHPRFAHARYRRNGYCPIV